MARRAPARPDAASQVARPRLSGRALPPLAAAALALSAAFGSLSADERSLPRSLRIASLDLADGAAALLGARPEPARPTWRTTFGSERKTEPKPAIGPNAIEADVVLVQGVEAIQIARRLFPARDWKLVVSRQMLASDDPFDPWSRDAVAAVPTTAVAVRYQEGLRVTGQEHLMELAAGPAGREPRPVAGTAVRLLAGDETLWVVSLDLNASSCAPGEADCREPASLASWRRAKKEGGWRTISGGRLSAREPSALPPPPCPAQAILASDPTSSSADVLAPGQRESSLGCIASLVVGLGAEAANSLP